MLFRCPKTRQLLQAAAAGPRPVGLVRGILVGGPRDGMRGCLFAPQRVQLGLAVSPRGPLRHPVVVVRDRSGVLA